MRPVNLEPLPLARYGSRLDLLLEDPEFCSKLGELLEAKGLGIDDVQKLTIRVGKRGTQAEVPREHVKFKE